MVANNFSEISNGGTKYNPCERGGVNNLVLYTGVV